MTAPNQDELKISPCWYWFWPIEII